jgi:hypothetical protein
LMHVLMHPNSGQRANSVSSTTGLVSLPLNRCCLPGDGGRLTRDRGPHFRLQQRADCR